MNHRILLSLLALGLSWGTTARAAVIFTEVNYNPPETGTDANEYIELTNTGSASVDMSGYKLIFGGNIVRYTFGAVTIQPMESILVTISTANLLATSGKPSPQLVYNVRSGTKVFQWDASAGLGNSSSTYVLQDSASTVLQTMPMVKTAPWPLGGNLADGGGATLEIVDVNAASLYDGSNWKVGAIGGSPGWLTSVPEPGSATLAVAAGLGLLRRRRSHR